MWFNVQMVELPSGDPSQYSFFSTDFGPDGAGVASPYVCLMFIQQSISAPVEIKGLSIKACLEQLCECAQFGSLSNQTFCSY